MEDVTARTENQNHFAQNREDQPAPQRKKRRRKILRRRVFWLILLVVVVAAAIVAGILILTRQQPATVPVALKTEQSVSFPLYYPSYLPRGYHFDEQSISQPESNVLLFSLSNSAGSKIYVSQEQKPAGFNFSSFNDELQQSSSVTTSIGEATIGQSAGNTVASLPTAKSWIVVNTTKPPADFSKLVTSFHRI